MEFEMEGSQAGRKFIQSEVTNGQKVIGAKYSQSVKMGRAYRGGGRLVIE
jgi:hypothetical protein